MSVATLPALSGSPSATLPDRQSPAAVRRPAPVAVIIEIADRAAGIAAPDGARFRFHASEARFQPLDGQIFRTPGDAERAARRVYNNRRHGNDHAALAREARR